MSWQAAVVGAIGATTFQQQGKIGKFNQSVNERNAKVAEARSSTNRKKN